MVDEDTRADGGRDGTPVDTGGEPVLELDSIAKTYGDIVALDDVDLAVDAGSFHCLVGPNGSGKTTLFRIVLGLTRPSAGTVSRPTEEVGCGFQHASVYRDLTVAENLSVFGSLAGGVDEAWRERLVETLRLDRVRDRPAGDLSGGFVKKLDLALALLSRPQVVLLDEPLGDLDDVSKATLLEFLAAYRDAGNAVVVSTHHLADFEPYLDRLTVLADGDVVLDGQREDIDTTTAGSLQDRYVALVRDRLRSDDPTTDG